MASAVDLMFVNRLCTWFVLLAPVVVRGCVSVSLT
jgi:hypothetical protein